MRQNKGSIVLTVILGLAVIGLISYVGNSPGRFLLNILMMAVIGFALFLVLRAVMKRRSGGGSSDEMKKYRQAVKQSKQKYNTQVEKPKQKTKKGASGKSRKKRRNRPHLTVIDGKKNTSTKEKKDRASN